MGDTTVQLLMRKMGIHGSVPTATSPGEKRTAKKCVTIGARSADVGGGEIDTLKEEHRNNLANPSLLWMVQQIDTRVAGICWAPDAFDDIPTLKAYFDAKRGPTSAKPRTREGSESVLPESVLDELKKDVQGTVHDSLGGVTSWWLLEYIPLWKPFLDGNKQQWKELNINRGRGREILHERPLFHRSVELLLNQSEDPSKAQSKAQYKPRARYSTDDPNQMPVYVDH
ncbi:hypothetical protein FRC05_004191 [Tulasnella sp. 425]|nr:hypothetical protein FRC05_004191 [Tulasnella sp. 425]